MASAELVEPRHPRLIGPYRIRRLLGEGGTSLVYLAEQVRSPRRLVALKVLKSHLLSEDSVARFERELQTLAVLNHPHIAQVYDFAARGRQNPYFTMEYVEGTSITAYCDEARLPVRARIELFLQVCDAVQYVHQNGVIHRDLKPSNVLVRSRDGDASVKLIDFGTAKLEEELWETASTLTESGRVMGTLCYMSPEQAGLSDTVVDTRTDVYALGVLLYALLTGRLPFDLPRSRAEYPEILRRIREEDAPRPSARLAGSGAAAELAAARGTEPAALRRELRGELDWILAKALEKSPARRYASVLELRRDLEAFLAGEAVGACPPTPAYRLRKAMRRHRRSLLATVGLFVALAVSTTLGALGFLRLDAEHQARVELLGLAQEVQIQVANAHLWFEEKLAGDAAVDLDADVWGPLATASRVLDASLARGSDVREDAPEGLVDGLEELQAKVEAFAALTRERWAHREEQGLTGGDLDQRYDESYRAILDHSTSLARGSKERFGRVRSAVAQTLLATNAVLLALLLAVGFGTLRLWRQGEPGTGA